MYHVLDHDAPEWRCVECDQSWPDPHAFMADPRDCVPAWHDRVTADRVAPVVWAGTAA
jgi:hypothetical protein